MDSELRDIHNFIKLTIPLRNLPDEAVVKLAREVRIGYVRNKDNLDEHSEDLLIIRKGALNHCSADGDLIEKLAEGELFNLYQFQANDNKLQAEEDSLIYLINYHKLHELIEPYPKVAQFFHQSSEERVSEKMAEIEGQAMVSATLSNRLVEDCYQFPITTIPISATVHDAALLMTEKSFSSLVVLSDDDTNQLTGMITDKDIRRRFVAKKLAYDTPVTEIMSTQIQTIDIKATAFDALMMMTSKHIHHIPVTKHGDVVGMVTATDLMNNEGNNTVNVSSMIHKANTIDELVTICELLPKVQIRMTLLGTRASHVAKSISAITMALCIRLAKLAEQKLGKAPVPYAWVGLGSQARLEQLIHTDQDNALIISDDMKPEDDQWFKSFAKFISDGLDKCGFIYCPGDVMASNDKWRQPQAVWEKYFKSWVTKPEPLALMHSSIFFDMETVYGDSSLVEDVRHKMLKLTKDNTIFLAHMTKNALSNRPPLGFFRDFVLISDGEHKSKLDIKHSGIAPIVDLARIYALSEGIPAVNTIERLQKAMHTSAVSKTSALNLVDAMRLLMQIRLEHQTRKLQNNQAPDNYLSLGELSRLERHHLKDAFKIIKTLQDNRQSIQ